MCCPEILLLPIMYWQDFCVGTHRPLLTFFNCFTALNNWMYHHLLGHFPIDLRLFLTFSYYKNPIMNTVNYLSDHMQEFLLAREQCNSWVKDGTNIKFWKIVSNSVKKAGTFLKLSNLWEPILTVSTGEVLKIAQTPLYFNTVPRLPELMWLVQGHAIKLQSRVFGFPAQYILYYNRSSGAKIRLEFWSNSFQQNEDVLQIIENMFSSFGFFSGIENN